MAIGGDLQKFDPNDPIIHHMLEVRTEYAARQNRDYSHVFRSKSVCDIIRLSCIILGVELAYAGATAFVSPLLLQAGMEHQHMTMVWSLSPLLGFFLSPLLGSLSDRCRSSLGRRRPLIAALCFGILLGVIFIPYGKYFGVLLGDSPAILEEYPNVSNITIFRDTGSRETTSSGPANFKFTIIFLILGTILTDFNVNMSQTPCRAYILEVSIPTDHLKVLSSLTAMSGIGGGIGYVLGGIDWKTTTFGSFFGGNVQTVFIIITVVFLISFIVTATSFREIPLPLIEKDKMLRPLTAAVIKKELEKKNQEANHQMPPKITTGSQVVLTSEMAAIAISTNDMFSQQIETENIDLEENEEKSISLKEYMISIIRMPKAMKILCLTNLLSWMADLSVILYFTDFVGEAVFLGSPMEPSGSEKAILFEQGVRFGCWGLSLQALSSAVYSSFIEKLTNRFGTKLVYAGNSIVFAVGMAILATWPTKIGVLFFCITASVIYSTVFTMPYMLVARYHSQGCFEIRNGEKVEMKQARGLGTDIAIVSSMLFLAQVIVSLTIGSIISLVQSTTAVLYTSSLCAIASALCTLKCLYLE